MRRRCLAERSGCNRALCSVCRRRVASQLETGSAAFCPAAHEQWDRKILTRTRARSNGKVLYRHQASKIFLSERRGEDPPRTILRIRLTGVLDTWKQSRYKIFRISGKMHNSWVTLPACVMTRRKEKKKKRKKEQRLSFKEEIIARHLHEDK